MADMMLATDIVEDYILVDDQYVVSSLYVGQNDSAPILFHQPKNF